MPTTFQPVPNTVELTVQGTQDGQLVENKFYAKAVETITELIVSDLVQIVADWVASSKLATHPNGYTHTRVVGRDLSSASSFEVTNSDHAGSVGTQSGATMPGNVAIAIHRETGLSGKKAKSRVYWPAIPTAAAVSPDVFGSTYAGQLITACEALRTALLAYSGATISYGYPQRKLNGVPLTTANFIEVTDHAVRDFFFDSQRRRLMGRGV